MLYFDKTGKFKTFKVPFNRQKLDQVQGIKLSEINQK